ncbi:hypothetical protein RchiOBHm_Chr7g0229041 [Rosa chinensis]|uniref:ER membrane protein complex subunit 2 n=1 Tax=Rosa chinensis TaxID=74649 RepID=A0A2P6PF11_ROSCH|nr:hypothetical protein RchiOBHm_Chr7g0229041 [Rosa chinensis]
MVSKTEEAQLNRLESQIDNGGGGGGGVWEYLCLVRKLKIQSWMEGNEVELLDDESEWTL